MTKAKQSLSDRRGIPKKKGVTVFGRQLESSIWAISPEIFIDEQTGMFTGTCNFTIVWEKFIVGNFYVKIFCVKRFLSLGRQQ